MADGYECEGQMSIYEFLDKEPEERKWNRIPDTFPKELGYRYDLQMKLVYADGTELITAATYNRLCFIIPGARKDETPVKNIGGIRRMELQIFNNSEFGQIRSLVLDDEVWFIGKDITMALGYSNDRKALQDNVDVEDRRLIQKSLCGTLEIPNRGVTAINESGLYSLVLRSKLPNAKKFKKWVTSEVLPSIRKTGSYQKPLSTQEMMRIQLGMIDDVSDRVTNLENTMNIDYGQQHSLGELISSRVIELVGGKKSNAYKEIGRKVFSEINHDYKDYFNVNARGNTPRLKYEEAVEYVKNWIPSTNTMMLIKDCNAQMPMPEDWR